MQTFRNRQFLLAILLTALSPGLTTAAQETVDRPNFIVIFCDDMGYADIGPFGAKGYETPNLQRMADEGMVFTSFCVARSVCSPSRAALMTGCYPVRVGVPGNFGPGSTTGLNPNEMTIAEVVKQRGYATAIYGKWHLGHLPPFRPMRQGFDEWFGLPYSHDMWPYHPEQGTLYHFPDLPLMENDTVVNPAMKPEDEVHLTQWYTERATGFIRRHQEEPFLIYLPHAMPHVPLFASERFAGKTERGLYGDVVTELDWSVGQILDTVRELQLDERTLVIFTSDNGPWLLYGDHAGSAGPLREGKGTAFEGGYRVPCVAWWPGPVPAGAVCDELASTIDVLPTIAHLSGSPLPPKKIDGLNIWPLLSGQPDAASPHVSFFFYSGLNLSGVRSGKWKLMFAQAYGRPDPPGTGGKPGKRGRGDIPLSLFDLENDVAESVNVADQHPEIVSRLQALAEEMRAELGDGRDRTGTGRRPIGRSE
jgi:arylsulfatase A